MLTGITIESFRGIRTGIVEGFGAVNVLVGPNGSGKSSLLEAIYAGAMGRDKVWLPDRPARRVLAERHNESVFHLKNVVYGKAPRPVSITYRIGAKEAKLELSGENWTMTGRDSDEIVQFFEDAKLLDVRYLLEKALEKTLWDAVLAIRADRVLTSSLKEIYGLEIEGLSYSAGSEALMLLLRDRDFALAVDDLGAGMRVALRVLMAAAVTSHSVFLFEEFDAFQHVDSLREFARALVTLTTANQTQLFLATHSKEALRRFLEAAGEGEGADFKVVQLSLSSEGVLESALHDADQTRTLLEAGIDPRKAG